MKFLLIEYEPRYLERIRQYLAGQSHTVELVMAHDGEEGLELYRKSRPDLVLISSVLPKLRTPEVIKGMQAMGPTPPVILMMSGYKGRNRRADAQRVGATSILEKPFSEDVFQAEVAMALGLRPTIEMPTSPGPPSDPGAPLLSSQDIFADVLTGLDDVPPTRPASREMPKPVPSVEKRLHDTLSGLMPPRKTPSGVSAPFPAAEAPGEKVERPVERTARVNVAEAMASLAARPTPVPRSGESQARSTSSVDKLLHDTLSGILPPPKTTAPAPPARPRQPKEISREVSGETARMKVTPLPPSVPPAPPPMPHPVDATRPTPAARRPPSSPGAFGRYQLLEKIGAGGMAEVFMARTRGERRLREDPRDQADPAAHGDERRRSSRCSSTRRRSRSSSTTRTSSRSSTSARSATRTSSRWSTSRASTCCASCRRPRRRALRLPYGLARTSSQQLAKGLDYAHRKTDEFGEPLGIVHRDVSPQNILLSLRRRREDRRLRHRAARETSTRSTGVVKGKFAYMSPEQARGERVDRRSDIFSVGIVLYEMLTGAPLFQGETDMSVLESVREGDVATPSSRGAEVPKRVDQIVLKALAKNPQDRYQNASEIEKDLHAVLYAFQPSPGPADLAIYLHRLLEAPQASDDEIDAAFDKARDMPQPVAPSPVARGSPEEGEGARDREGAGGRVRTARDPRVRAASGAGPAPCGGRARGRAAGGGRIPEEPRGPRGRHRNRRRRARRRRPLRHEGPLGRRQAARDGGRAEDGARDREHGSRSLRPPSAPAPEQTEPAKVVDPRAVEAEARRLAAEREKAIREAAKHSGTAGKPATASVTPSAAVGLAPVKVAEPPRPADVPVAVAAAPEPVSTAVPVPSARKRSPPKPWPSRRNPRRLPRSKSRCPTRRPSSPSRRARR